MKTKIKFCWLCSKKLWGNHRKVLTIDEHPRTLHKQCAKKIEDGEDGFDYRKMGNQYVSLPWHTSGEDEFDFS